MYQVQSTKYGIRVIRCFLLLLYEVQSTKYQVWDCASRVMLLIHFESILYLEDTLYLVLGTLYKSVFPTLYLVLGTLYLKKLFSPPNVLPACFFDPFGGMVDVLAKEEVELPHMVLHMP